MEAIQKSIQGSYSRYQWNIIYSHYQRSFNTEIIDQPNHLSRRRTDYPACHHRCGGHMREFEPEPDSSPAGKCHGHGAQFHAYLTDSWEGKRNRKGWRHAKGRFFLRYNLQIEFANPNFRSYLRLPSAIQRPRYC